MTSSRLLPHKAAATTRSKGFSLIEIAVGLLILTLILGSLLGPLQTQVNQHKVDETEKILNQAMDALLGFAASNNRLPCPATSTSNGLESFAGGGNATNGNCSPSVGGYFNGFLPAATLGFTPIDAQGYALDSWGLQQNRIRYAVSNNTVNSVTNPFTSVSGLRSAGISSFSSSGPNLLYVCASSSGVTGSDCGTATTLASNAVVVIWSLGPNAPSEVNADGTPTGNAGADEALNIDSNRIFVWHTPAAVNAPNGEFDDLLVWLSPNALIGKMISAGQLP